MDQRTWKRSPHRNLNGGKRNAWNYCIIGGYRPDAAVCFFRKEVRMMMDTEIEFSKEFQNKLLDLVKMCYENHTNTCTVTFEYPNAVMEIDFTVRVKKRDEDGNVD